MADQNNVKTVNPGQGKYRLQLHLMPPAGWMSDPNGLCYFKHHYHVFFQYSQNLETGKPSSWGHYSSPDLLHWQFHGAAICPDMEWDRDGAYSGSAFTADGKMELFYTGNVKEKGEYDYILDGRQANVLYTVSRDGLHFSKKQRLLTNADYPAGYTLHVRDPKVFRKDGGCYMALGGRRTDGRGAAILYESAGRKHWHFCKELTTREPFGYMWECPDLFQLEDVWVLICCPQGLAEEKYRFQNRYQSGYFRCDDFTLRRGDYLCDRESFEELDYGFDFYAPQTFTDPKGRRLLFGWAGIPEEKRYGNEPTIRDGWQHAMTVPRELFWNHGRLCQRPVKELDELRIKRVPYEGNSGMIKAQAFDLLVEFSGIHPREKRGVLLGDDVLFVCENGCAELKFLSDAGCGRTLRSARMRTADPALRTLRVLRDTSLLEIYVNDGELVFTTRWYPKSVQETALSLVGPVSAAEVWEFKGMEVDFGEYGNTITGNRGGAD